MHEDSIRRFVSALCLLLLLAGAPALFAQAGPPDNRVPVIVGFRNQPGPGDEAGLRSMGGAVKYRYTIIPAIAARLPQAAIDALVGNPAVSVIEPDVTVYALDEYATAWGVGQIGAKAVHDSGNKGATTNVCVIDTGIDTDHVEFIGNYKGGYDFVNRKVTPEDDNGHGTHTAGTIGALLNNSGVVGVAPSVNLYAYKVLNSAGSGSFSDVIAAVQACADLAVSSGRPTVSNNSYGSSGDPGSQVEQAFANAYAAGVLHVAAAGNTGNSAGTGDNVGYPARYDSVIAVAATDTANSRAYFSSTGPKVELAAPGVNIKSTYYNGDYVVMSGTSMASPHVAGVAALVFGCGLTTDLNGDGKINNLDVRLRMQQTAQDLGTSGRDTKFGFGLVRADLAALNCGTGSGGGVDTIPNAPSGLSIVSYGKTNIRLAWTDNSSNETGFELYRCGGAGCLTIPVAAANTQTYNDTGLSRRTTYTYRVRAVNSAGPSKDSNQVSQKTQ